MTVGRALLHDDEKPFSIKVPPNTNDRVQQIRIVLCELGLETIREIGAVIGVRKLTKFKREFSRFRST